MMAERPSFECPAFPTDFHTYRDLMSGKEVRELWVGSCSEDGLEIDSAADARALAAWLMRAADWLEEGE